MVMTASTMRLPLAAPAPPFRLPDTSGRLVSLDDFAGRKALLVAFICNHCPFVVHVRSEFAKLAREAEAKGVGVVGINSNDVAAYPGDSPEKMREEVKRAGYSFPYLFDETQEVAKSYGAACTPDFFLFDSKRRLFYRGRMDDSTPGNDRKVTGADLRAAIDAVLAGAAPSPDAKPSIGCNIKWKPGNAPAYFQPG